MRKRVGKNKTKKKTATSCDKDATKICRGKITVYIEFWDLPRQSCDKKCRVVSGFCRGRKTNKMKEKEWYTKEEAARKMNCTTRTIERKINLWQANAKDEDSKRLIDKKVNQKKLRIHRKLINSNFNPKEETKRGKSGMEVETKIGGVLVKELKERIGKLEIQIERKDDQISKLLDGEREFRILLASQGQQQQQIEDQSKTNPVPTQKTTQPKAQIDSLAIIVGAIIISISLILTMLIAGR